jgi:hypothetical protein
MLRFVCTQQPILGGEIQNLGTFPPRIGGLGGKCNVFASYPNSIVHTAIVQLRGNTRINTPHVDVPESEPIQKSCYETTQLQCLLSLGKHQIAERSIHKTQIVIHFFIAI